MMDVPRDWFEGVVNESAKNFLRRLDNGFFAKYLAGDVILDIGYRGGCGVDGHGVFFNAEKARPVLPRAIGIDVGYPGYDGLTLPFATESVDTVYSSHVLEHIRCYAMVICDWYRVLKVGGFMVVIVPHKFLYERASRPPSNWNQDHYRFYSPAVLLSTVEEIMPPNSYRVRHLCDNDIDYDYSRGPDRHPVGSYEIELVLEKIKQPDWTILP
jgi:SAM-dependent methyltransferase